MIPSLVTGSSLPQFPQFEARVAVLKNTLAAPGIYPAWAIFEATDIAEYAALSSADKEAYKILTSPGFCKLVEGSNAWTLLVSMFGPGTETRANLLALIS